MGLWQSSTFDSELFNSFEMILNKSTLSYAHSNIKNPMSKEEKNNYSFICEFINYYQSLKNNININKKYSFFIISSKTKNISSFRSLKRAKEIFINWIKLLYKTPHNTNSIIEEHKLDINSIKMEIINNIKQSKLFDIFIENFNNYYNSVNNKLFIKLILSGLPNFLRPIIWKIILEKNSINKNRPSMKESLKQNINEENLKQICKDINRTFIIMNEDTAATIERVDDEKVNQLKNVLIAVSNYNSEIGYTQGMNNIIGFILKVTKFDEEKAYDLSILIMEKIKGYFMQDFPLLKEQLNKFNELFKIKNNKLYNHFKNNQMPDELWIGKWLQTLFTINLPYNEVCQIWDSLIVFGFDFIIYISLAIVYFAQNELFKLDDSSDFAIFFKEMLNPNPGVKKYIENAPNYKDYIIPTYHIISRAKKIKMDLLFNDSSFNSFNNYTRANSICTNTDVKEKNSQLNLNQSLNSQNSILSRFNSQSSLSLTTKSISSNLSEVKSASEKNLLNVKNNNIKNLSKFYEKKEVQSSQKINNNNKPNITRKYSDSSDFSINFIKTDSDINFRRNSEVIDYKNKDIKNIVFNNHYFNKENPNTNYFQNRNYAYTGINRINLNEKKNISNFVNGRPRRNIKLLVHKKNNNINHLIDNSKLSSSGRTFISKSPQNFNNIKASYNYNNQKYLVNNLTYGQLHNNIIPNNNFIVNPQRRGSYNFSLPVNFYFGYINSPNLFI